MRRFWLGVGILLVLLVSGILVTRFAAEVQEPIGKLLLDAAEQAQLGAWTEAEDMFHRANSRWERYRDLTAVVTDHTPMEQIDATFRRLEVYLQQKDSLFSAGCAELSAWVEAVADAQAVTWWSIL